MRLGKLTTLVAALTLLAAPASALTVTYTGSNPITAAATAGTTGPVVLQLPGQTLSCATSNITATINTSIVVADISAGSWSSCTTSGQSATVSASIPPTSKWHFNALGGYTSAGNDQVSGTITNINGLHVVISGPFGGCGFDLSGTLDATFDEDNGVGSQTIEFRHSSANYLTVSNVSNAFACLSLVANGDSVGFTGAYRTSTSAGAINIAP